MKYRLKDQELQAKLDEISDGDFSKKLATNWSKIFYADRFVVRVHFGGADTFSHNRFIAYFEFDEVEKHEDYNPHGWNNWPEAMPPEAVLMRVEYVNSFGAKRKECAIFYKGEWVNFDGYVFEGVSNLRFRPWEEEE